MQKELIISTTPQETKLAILEDDELVEVYIERHRSQGIVGNIYKGKVTKVLPGMQSAFVDIGLDRDAFLYVSDFFEDTEEYEKIVSTVEDEVAQLQETGRGGKPALPALPAPIVPPIVPIVAAPVAPVAAAEPLPAPEPPPREISAPVVTQIQPLPGEVLSEGERPAAAAAPGGPAMGGGPGGHDDYDRRGDRRGGPRRDRDRRGKKPKIPSFETKSYEPRVDDRPFSGSLEVLPGESLAKLSRRPEGQSDADASSADSSEQPFHEGEQNAGLGAVAEEPPKLTPEEVDAALSPAESESKAPSESTETGLVTEASAPSEVPSAEETSDRANVSAIASTILSEPTENVAHEAEHSGQPAQATETEKPKEGNETEQSDESSSGKARITDRSDKYQFAHRSAGGRRARRGRGGPPPTKPEEQQQQPPQQHRPANGPSPRAIPMISELLREGQEILVQVSKEPLGKKGARITSHIALPGRYLVYMPTVDHVGVSRKIASDEERMRLKRIINEHKNGLPGGFIVRTAAEGRGEDEFVQDIRFLGNLWSDIRSKSEKKAAPTLIHRDLNLVQRLLRDQLSQDYRAIRLDNESEFATVLDFVSKFQPALVNRVKLHLKDTPIFEEYGLNTEIEKALRPKVWLKSGGYIVINQTEALVAIDVNTGKFVGKSNRLEDTIVRTNVDAVHEIVRQIRLRNLGGIIVVDFIDMEEKKNRQRVMAALEEAVRADRVPSKILQFNDFGLVAITRKRTQPSLERTLCRPCTYCNGSGWSKSPETICYDIQQEIKKMVHLFDGKEITVRVNPEIAKALKSGEFVSLSEIEDWTKKDIIVKSDPLLHEEHFDIN
jgi:ribonuclease G